MADKKNKKRLGKGLAALIGDVELNQEKQEDIPVIEGDRQIAIEWLRANPNNPRRIFLDSELNDLANSIAEHGVVQPILVRPITGQDFGGAKYEIIAGERRWRASQKAGLTEVPVLIREVQDRQALEIAIIENVQRSDLNAVEEAMGYQQLIDEYDYSQQELSKIIGKSRSHVANTLRLLKLPEEIRQMVNDDILSAGHARTLVTAEDPLALAQKIVDGGLSVRQSELLAQKQSESNAGKSNLADKASPSKSTDLIALENRLSDRLGLEVRIDHKPCGDGQVIVHYRNLEQLDAVCRKLER